MEQAQGLPTDLPSPCPPKTRAPAQVRQAAGFHVAQLTRERRQGGVLVDAGFAEHPAARPQMGGRRGQNLTQIRQALLRRDQRGHRIELAHRGSLTCQHTNGEFGFRINTGLN